MVASELFSDTDDIYKIIVLSTHLKFPPQRKFSDDEQMADFLVFSSKVVINHIEENNNTIVLFPKG